MKNNEIEQLIRMTREIEDLEASAGTAHGRASGGATGDDYQQDALVHRAGGFSFAAAKEKQLALAAVERARVRSATWWRHAFTAAAVVVLGGIALKTLMPLMSGGSGGGGGSGGNRPVAVAPIIDVPALAKNGESGKPTPKLTIAPRPSLVPKLPYVPKDRLETAAVIHVASNEFVHDGCEGGGGGEGGEGGFDLNGYPQEMASRIIAFSLDSESHCACSQTVLHAWAGDRGAGEVTRAELLEMGFETSCITTPDRIMVVAVSGPVNELPITDEQVRELARCVDLNPSDDGLIDYLGHDEGKYAAAAMSCLTSGLQVDVVTLLAK